MDFGTIKSLSFNFYIGDCRTPPIIDKTYYFLDIRYGGIKLNLAIILYYLEHKYGDKHLQHLQQ